MMFDRFDMGDAAAGREQGNASHAAYFQRAFRHADIAMEARREMAAH